MKIIDIQVIRIRYISNIVMDSEGHSHPGAEHEAFKNILKIICEDGLEGYSFGRGIQEDIIANIVKPALIGQNPLYRERMWQMLRTWQRLNRQFTDQILAAVDEALWDIAGKITNLPVYQLIGAYRDTVPAYGSIMVGDDFPGGLDTPEAYANFAMKLVERGYKAIKLHTWMPPIIPNPDPKMDVAACTAVREAVGPDIKLMLDSYHDYSRMQALYLGRELEKLDFYWIEEPMNEHSMSSYKWLAENLNMAVIGPETAEGKNYARAEWIVAGASDINRAGDYDVGGITPLLKTVHLCESFNVGLELHGNSLGNLHVMGAMGIPGEYYERGLLHPFLDYDVPEPWFNTRFDAMDRSGMVRIPTAPGMGWDINFDYIKENSINK